MLCFAQQLQYYVIDVKAPSAPAGTKDKIWILHVCPPKNESYTWPLYWIYSELLKNLKVRIKVYLSDKDYNPLNKCLWKTFYFLFHCSYLAFSDSLSYPTGIYNWEEMQRIIFSQTFMSGDLVKLEFILSDIPLRL